MILVSIVIALLAHAHAEPLTLTPLPIEAIAREPAIKSVNLSPDGKHIAALISRPEHRWPLISIWDADDTSSRPALIPAQNARPFSLVFIGSRHILFRVDKPVGNNRFARRAAVSVATDLQGSEFTQLFETSGAPDGRPDFLLTGSFDAENRYLYQTARGSRPIYTLDAETLKVEWYQRGRRRIVQGTQDVYLVADVRDGTLMVRENVRLTSAGWQVYREVRNRLTDTWEEHPALGYPVRNRRVVVPLGFYDADPNKLFVAANLKSDFAAIWVYDVDARTWESEPAFASNQADVVDVLPELDWQAKRVRGVSAYTTRALAPKTTFVDGPWAAVQNAIEARFPGLNVTFGDHDRDGKKRLVTVSGPKHPPAFFVLKNGQELTALAKARPWIDPASLGETKARTYVASDGLSLPSFVTLPPGYRKDRHGRLPLVVLPHGGPWARDDLDWDDSGWPQILATRGYAVVQPQFRGSSGWGMPLWQAGDRQWGLKMQDDLDDAAAWLVADGVADPANIAILGYSYGGYAAVVATMRGRPLYRCAIAGSPVAHVKKASQEIGANRIGRELQAWTVEGFEPLEHIADMSIPLMLFHGTHDTVLDDTATSEVLFTAMKAAGKNVAYHPIQGMWHVEPWYPEWKRETLYLITSYLAGPNCFNEKLPSP